MLKLKEIQTADRLRDWSHVAVSNSTWLFTGHITAPGNVTLFKHRKTLSLGPSLLRDPDGSLKHAKAGAKIATSRDSKLSYICSRAPKAPDILASRPSVITAINISAASTTLPTLPAQALFTHSIMHLKNIIAYTAALMLGQAVAYPTEPMPQTNEIRAGHPTKRHRSPRAAAVEQHHNTPARRDERAQQEAKAQHAVQSQHMSQMIKAMKTAQNGQTMTEDQARNDYLWAFSLGGPSVDDFDESYYNPDAEYYGFGPGSSDDGTYYNMGYYQYDFNGNGMALQTPYGTYDVSRGKWADNRPSNWADDDDWYDDSADFGVWKK
ncbi:hypothetical protein BST61_g5878 [Cercospora zeina]